MQLNHILFLALVVSFLSVNIYDAYATICPLNEVKGNIEAATEALNNNDPTEALNQLEVVNELLQKQAEEKD